MYANEYRFDGSSKLSLKEMPTCAEPSAKKKECAAQTEANLAQCAILQEKLYASGMEGLVIAIQARDAAGKDSLIKKVFGKLNPAALVTHIGGLNAVVDTVLNLPSIPGGKKLIYNHIDLPLTAIEDFEKLVTEDLYALFCRDMQEDDLYLGVFCHIHHVRYNSACSWKFPGTTTIEHCITQHISAHEYCVEYIVYATERVLLRKNKWCNHTTYTITDSLAGCQQFDRRIHLTSIRKICFGNFSNTFCINIFKIN